MMMRIEIRRAGDRTPWLSVESEEPLFALSAARKMALDEDEVTITRKDLALRITGTRLLTDDTLEELFS